MNLSNFLKMTYENKFDWTLGENKSNSNPIKPKTKPKQTQFPKGQNEIKLLFKKEL